MQKLHLFDKKLNNLIMRKYLFAMWLFVATLDVMGSNLQTIIVNGEPLTGKTVTKMTFNGSGVTLVFNDNTSDTYDMELVRVVFGTTVGINDISVAARHGIIDGELVVGGISAGTTVSIFDMYGKMVASKKSDTDTVSISINGLKNGVYVMSAGSTVVKFIKK